MEAGKLGYSKRLCKNKIFMIENKTYISIRETITLTLIKPENIFFIKKSQEHKRKQIIKVAQE